MNLCHLNKETGRNMPDISLFESLCKELDITINELLSGEKLSKEEYQEKFEENVVSIIKSSHKKINVLKKISIIYLVLCIIFLTTIFSYFLYNYEMFNQKYNENGMFITKENNEFVFYSSILGNVEHKIIKYNNENVLVINFRSSLKEINDYSENDKISTVQLLNNIKNSSKINKVYFTDINIKKFNDKNKLDNLIKKSYLIYENK